MGLFLSNTNCNVLEENVVQMSAKFSFLSTDIIISFCHAKGNAIYGLQR